MNQKMNKIPHTPRLRFYVGGGETWWMDMPSTELVSAAVTSGISPAANG